MFTDLNEKLIVSKKKMRKKVKYEEHIERLHASLQAEKSKKNKLEKQLLKEKEDVTRLESFSLSNIFYTIIGRKLEKLDKEQQEVLAAKLKYTEALETISDMERELEEYKDKHLDVAYADIEYEKIIQEKERLIHDKHSIWSERLYTLADREATITASLKEYEEAIEAGNSTVLALNRALNELNSAKNWSTFDMFGGGIISTAMKHSRFDEAKRYIHQAQSRLRQFQEELLDIESHFDANFETGGLLTFADYFFDGIIVDWIVHGKINDCYDQTEKTKIDVSRVLKILLEQKSDLEKELINVQAERVEVLES
ncbi:hypothetical protein ACWE42_20065 [Sutcliffiella cohnii]